MNKIINVYKPIGLTPLQLIIKLRSSNLECKEIKIGFAGRLDPLAHGVMLLMVGEETKNRNKYLGLPKEYTFEVLFGVSTDTYDALGILKDSNFKPVAGSLEEKINIFVKTKLGKQTQPYPPFSSKEVDGKPLFQWARENKLSEINIPKREIEIYNFELLNISEIPANEIHERIISKINSVEGDFRQAEILKKWNESFKKNKLNKLSVAELKINCSSGTYVRSLADELGKIIGAGAIALSILRTSVGEHTLKNSMQL